MPRRTPHPSDARLWAHLCDEFRSAGADRDARQLHARRAVALVRRERARGTARTFAPGEEVPYDVMCGYDLDGDVWERQSEHDRNAVLDFAEWLQGAGPPAPPSSRVILCPPGTEQQGEK